MLDDNDLGNLLRAYKLYAYYEDNDKELGDILSNTLVTTGQFDVASTTDMSKKLSERIKQSKYVEIPNGRHLCNIECDEVFNKILEGFIDKKTMTKLKEYKMFIDGKWINSESGKTFKTLNPENNKPWAIVPEASEVDVDNAVNAAQKAFEGEWPKLMPRERAKYVRKIGEKLRENAELLGKIETIDTGKLFKETNKQANYIAEYYDYYADLADKVEGTVLPIDKKNIQAITTRIPIGVIAAIIPWNSQMFLTATKIAPALVMGNTVVIKSSELAPAVMFEFAKLIEETGIPNGVVNVITGYGEPCGKSLTSHNLVEKVAFTGGPETARQIIQNSSKNLSEVSLELGGKSPVAVFEDAHQENALNGIVAGIFGASGQSCIAGSKIIFAKWNL